MSGVSGVGVIEDRFVVLKRHGSSAVSRWWLFGAVAAIMYGSLLPFDVHLSTLLANGTHPLAMLSRSRSPLEDILTNILLYVPFGALLVLCSRWRHRRPFRQLLTATALGILLSFTLEVFQAAIPTRVSSRLDVWMNMVGTGIGALLGLLLSMTLGSLGRRFRMELATKPYSLIAVVLTLGLFLYELVPFDFVLSTAALHRAFNQAVPNLHFIERLSAGGTDLAQWADHFGGAMWYLVLGYVWALASFERKGSLGGVRRHALTQGLVLATITESLQLFTASHQFELFMIPWRGLAAIVGAWLAIAVTRRQAVRKETGKTAHGLPTGFLAALGVVQIAFLFGTELGPRLSTAMTFHPIHQILWPFEALWRRPMSVAAGNVISLLATYGTLTATLFILVQRFSMAPVWRITAGAVLLTASALEVIQSSIGGGVVDPTPPMMAALAVIAVWKISRMRINVPHLSQRRGVFHPADDLFLPAVNPVTRREPALHSPSPITNDR